MADTLTTHRVVRRAQAGDQQAIDELVAAYLPLLYNIIGRALDGHADVDDVVQETMLRVLRKLPGLRDPGSFRSWLVAIAVRQVRDRWRANASRPTANLDSVPEIADPGADFVDLTITRLGLTGQRRETAEATRWLDQDDRQLLSLWWLEAAGRLTRKELAAALDLSAKHAAVRVQRMKAQLGSARVVIRALWASPRCADLLALAADWDGRPDPLWRKRFARHTRECERCERHWRDLVPADRLLAGLAMVPVPAALRVTPATTAAASAGRTFAGLATKPLVVISAGLLTIGGVAGIAYASHESPAPDAIPATVRASTPPPTVPTTTITTTTAAPPPTTTTHTRTTPTSTPATTSVPAGPVYGETVDAPDTAPAVDQRPGALPKRPETTPITVTGKYEAPFKGSLGGTWLMFYRNDYTTITGRGYFRIRWEVAYFNRVGQLVMPTWTGLRGKLFHVASGGGRRMDDEVPGQTDTPHTWMGRPSTGYDTLPAGAQQMWNNEYFYLDGTVTLHENEGWADYNLSVTPVTWADVSTDINTAPNGGGVVRYGMVRDTGDDSAPAPEYLTRQNPASQADVTQHSQV